MTEDISTLNYVNNHLKLGEKASKKAPGQKALLRRHNFCEYPTIQEPKPLRFKPQFSKNLTDEKASKRYLQGDR